jgi:hypothetical protein
MTTLALLAFFSYNYQLAVCACEKLNAKIRKEAKNAQNVKFLWK